jgi:hypothetical protein
MECQGYGLGGRGEEEKGVREGQYRSEQKTKITQSKTCKSHKKLICNRVHMYR